MDASPPTAEPKTGKRAAKKARSAYGSGSVWKEPRARGGGEVWVGQVRVAGKQRQRTLGPSKGPDALSTREARRALETWRTELEIEAVRRARQNGADSLKQVAERHLAYLERELRHSTLVDYQGHLANHILPFFGDVPLSDIRVADVETFIHHQKTEVEQQRLNPDGTRKVGLSGSTIANHVNYLHSIFAFAERHEIVQTNPVKPARKPKIRKQDQDFSFLTLDQIEQVIAAVPNDYLGPTTRALILTAALTGLRQGELIALRWRDINWTEHLIQVKSSISRGRRGDPKSETSKREVPLGQRVADTLHQHRGVTPYNHDDDPVLCHPLTGNPLDAGKARERFYDAMKAAGMGHMLGQSGGGIVFHSLRHTFGTQMASAGAPLVAIKEWMGHADIQTTMIYAKWAKDRNAERALVDAAFSA